MMPDEATSSDVSQSEGSVALGLLQTVLECSGLSEEDAQKAAHKVIVWKASVETNPWLDGFFGLCESPMERRFLAGLLLDASVEFEEVEEDDDGAPYACSVRWDSFGEESFRVEPQKEEYYGPTVGCIRIDFIVEDPGELVRLAIEIDGHEFHEKTKEQAARDKARDRALARDGYIVLRFAGSEVFKDPRAAWGEVLEILAAALQRQTYDFGLLRERLKEEILEELTAPVALLPPHAETPPQ